MPAGKSAAESAASTSKKIRKIKFRDWMPRNCIVYTLTRIAKKHYKLRITPTTDDNTARNKVMWDLRNLGCRSVHLVETGLKINWVNYNIEWPKSKLSLDSFL